MKEVELLRKLLVFIFLICISFVSASVDSLDLVLDKSIYGIDQSFEGSLNFETSSEELFSVHEEIRTKFESCGEIGSNTEYHSLYDILVNEGLFSGPEYIYDLGDYTSSVLYNENTSEDSKSNVDSFLISPNTYIITH